MAISALRHGWQLIKSAGLIVAAFSAGGIYVGIMTQVPGLTMAAARLGGAYLKAKGIL
jgi:NhaP-type Na+/H+ or K+/H+ antiporter